MTTLPLNFPGLQAEAERLTSELVTPADMTALSWGPIIRYHADSHRPVTMTSKIEPIAAPSCRPIDLTCPTCGAKPRTECDRRTMGKRWQFHRARVDAAGGAR